MKYLILLISSAYLLQEGLSKPSYSGGHESVGHIGYGNAAYAPVEYNGPLATTKILTSGHIADTPEVTAAKKQHYSAIQKAEAEAVAHGYSGEGDDEFYGSGAGSGAEYKSSHDTKLGNSPVGYHGPLAIPKVLSSGHIADTPEVTAAKKQHYSAFQKAEADGVARGYSGTGDDGSYGHGSGSGTGYASSHDTKLGNSPVGYHGPLSIPKVLSSGHIADTPEVTAAKQQHYSAFQKAEADGVARGYSATGDDGSYGNGSGSGTGYASSHGTNARHSPVGYNGPLATTKVLSSGYIADTPEVTAAKQQHYSAIQKSNADGVARGYSGTGDDGSYEYGSGSGTGYASSHGTKARNSPVGYHGPLAIPKVLSSGHIADTIEVTAAKQLHFSAIYKAKADASLHENSRAGYASFYRSGYGGGTSHVYSGPLAYPKILPSGQLVDTHEVAKAKQAHLNAVAVSAREHAEMWANNDHH